MFRIKICGVRQTSDVEAAISAGADAIGHNFVPSSPRSVSPAEAVRLSAAAEGIARTGVFVNVPAPEIQYTLEFAQLTHVQLHGEESDEVARTFAPHQVVRAWRIRDRGTTDVRRWLQKMIESDWRPAAVLLDAYAPGSHGGTGITLDWSQLDLAEGCLEGIPIILAGGLTPDNVGQAIRQVRPRGVDVASGVEKSPGEKDPRRIRAFVREALAAFAEVATAAGRPPGE